MLSRKQRGFTLVELLVVIAIIALLASIILASFGQARAKARDSKRMQDLLEVQKALELYRASNNQLYPPDPNNNTRTGLSCWDCGSGEPKDNSPRLAVLSPFLNPRPCDPKSSVNGGVCNLTLNGRVDAGYYYKVNTSRTDYKLAIVGSFENINNAPTKLKDAGFSGRYSNNTISISSSAKSQSWSQNCRFDGQGQQCQ